MYTKAELKKRIEAYMDTFHVRGAQVAVVKDNDVIYCEGYGIRNEKSQPVTTKTVYPLASCTKSFTGTLCGMMVDEGLIKWDDTVKSHYPKLKLYDKYVEEYATFRDFLAHRTSIARHEFAWMGTGKTMDEVTEGLQHLKPMGAFRSLYHYNNMTYSTITNILGKLKNKHWSELMKEYITEPLGMADTTFSVNQTVKEKKNYAVPYSRRGYKIFDLPLFNIDNVAGAGAINTTAEDLVKWVKFQLINGKLDGKQLIKPETIAETKTPQIVGENSKLWMTEFIHSKSYCLGWVREVYKNKVLVYHTGGINGFFTKVTLVPEENMAVIVLTNCLTEDICAPVTYELIDNILELEYTDWYERNIVMSEQNKKQSDMQKQYMMSMRRENTKTSVDIEEYAGVYQCGGYNDAVVEADDGVLSVTINYQKHTAQHFNYDVFVVDFGDMLIPLEFSVDKDGRVKSVMVTMGLTEGEKNVFIKKD